MARTTKAGTAVAYHLGLDYADMEDNRYQSTRYSRPVYTVDDDYWSAGPTPPTSAYRGETWVKVISSFDGKTVLWRMETEEEQEAREAAGKAADKGSDQDQDQDDDDGDWSDGG